MERKIGITTCMSIIMVTFTFEVFAGKVNQLDEIASGADEYLTRLTSFGFSGSILISRGEAVVLNKGYGMANPGEKVENTTGTVFSLGSIVKPFTASLIMKLVQEGRLTLEATLENYFPKVPSDKVNIQVHHLLSHTSGLAGAIGRDIDYVSKRDYLQKVWNSTLEFDPGKRYSYSNVGFTLLAMIIEQVTGLEYEQYLKQSILDPAGMTQTGYRTPDWDNQMIAHNLTGNQDNGTFLDREHYPSWHLIGNGGMLSTTMDMYKFYLYLKGDQFLSSATKKKMWTPVMMDDAYGWVNIDQGEILQHNGGGADGNGALMKWYPKDDIFMILFTNATMEGKLGFMVVEQPLEEIIFGEEVPLPPKIVPYDRAEFNDIGGKYRSGEHIAFEVSKESNGFRFLPQNQATINLFLNDNSGSEFLSDQWNRKIDLAMRRAVENKEYQSLETISKNPGRLRKSIINELEMEGYERPASKVLYSIKLDQSTTMTVVAISENDFAGESMLFQMIFKDGNYAGLGVDFGPVELPKITAIPTDRSTLIGYDFASSKRMGVEIEMDEKGKLIELTCNDTKLTLAQEHQK